MIVIGAIERGPELEGAPIAKAVSLLARVFDEPAEPRTHSIEVVFDIPGSLGAPGFEGFQVAKERRSQDEHRVFVAVPPDVAAQRDPAMSLVGLVQGAVTAVAAQSGRSRGAIDAEALHAEIVRVRAHLFDLGHTGPDLSPSSARGSDRGLEAFEDGYGFRIDLTIEDDGALDIAFDLEAAVDRLLRAKGIGYVDGNEVGAGSFVIYAYGADGPELESSIRGALRGRWSGPVEIVPLEPTRG